MLLEDPELSLHPEIVRMLPQMFARVQRRTGRQIFVSTPRPLGTPMPVLPPQMRRATHVVVQLDVVELRNRDSKRLLDTFEARLASPVGRPRDLLEEVATEGIIRSADGPRGVADELGHDVQVADAREEGR